VTDHEPSIYTPDVLDGFFCAKVPTQHPLGQEGSATLVIEPLLKSMTLRTSAGGPIAEVAKFDRLAFDEVEDADTGEWWFELRIAADGVAYEAYTFAVSIVDQIESGRTYRAAVDEALETFRDLLAPRKRLSDEQEIGLFGELGVYEHLLTTIGEESATRSWVGSDEEEHDFVLADADVEVKTTRGEARIHTIGSVTQLQASPGRPLFLASLQFTAAGGAADGESLPARIERIRGQLSKSRAVFDSELRAAGWDDRDAFELYKRRYVPRSTPRTFLVDEKFPAITSSALDATVARPELIVSVSYRIDLSSSVWQDPLVELAGFAEGAAHVGT
jgi:hypothetical protein